MVEAQVKVAVAAVAEGGMRAAEAGGRKVLFVRDAKGIRAFSATCPHEGAPLEEGKICAGRLYCPWHKAVFDVGVDGTGALLEPPALHGLDRYPVRIEDGEAIALPTPMRRDSSSVGILERSAANTVFVIVGTGAAATSAVITLREAGYVGRIVMIGPEPYPPYDRTMLSKAFLARRMAPEATFLDSAMGGGASERGFADEYCVEMIRATVERIDLHHRRLELDDGGSIAGDAVLIATGSDAARPPIPGAELDHVLVLRSLADAHRLSSLAENGRTIVIVGSGFIGLEAASFLTDRGADVTLVSTAPLPMADRFGAEIAQRLIELQRQKGVRLHLGREVTSIERDEAALAVLLDDGTRLPCDLVLLATGAVPATRAITGLPVQDDGGIEVDDHLAVANGVYVAGDIAAFPERHSGLRARIEHWRLAQQHGIHAALNMVGRNLPFARVPYFWSNQAGQGLDYAGYAPRWDRIIMRGAKEDFIAYYILDGKAVAACSLNRKHEFIAFMHLLETDRLPAPAELEAGIQLAALI